MKTIVLTFGAFAGAAIPAMAQQLIAVDSSRALYSIDFATGAKTQIGTVSSNASTTAGLAYDPTTASVYLTSTGNDSLYTLDITTGTATLVGTFGSSSFVMHGLEFDTSTNTLYGVSQHDNGLYVISTTTGVATLVGTSGLTSFSNLGYDSLRDVMYSTNSGTDSFYELNRATGGVALVGPLLGPTNPNGLAFDPVQDVLYMVDNNTDSLYRIDRGTGAATLVGSTGSGNLLGLVYIPAATPQVTAYCTAGTSTNGCVPTMGATGTASVSASSGFTLDVANLEGQQSGLIFYGINGRVATPWGSGGNSFFCVKAPVERMGVQNSGGTSGACDGAMSADWLAFVAATPGALGTPFSAGATVDVQCWYRDPPAVKTTNLSGGLEFITQP